MNGYSISKATLGRLPQYLQYLRSLPEPRIGTISATSIAKGLCLGDVQVRKDLAVVSGAGRPKVGYVKAKLIGDLERFLGYEKITNAVLVGAGKLGSALLGYGGFEDFGVKIVAGFDCDDSVVQEENKIKTVLPIDELESYCKSNRIALGIITVDKEAAQSVCDKLVSCGITAIWNFAPCSLKVPSGVLLKQENLALSLAYLNNQLNK